MTTLKAKARDVRTGDVITTPYVRNGVTLTVDFLTWEKFNSPDGCTCDVIRFTGVDSLGRTVDKGWGQRPDSRVYVLSAAPHAGNTFGNLA